MKDARVSPLKVRDVTREIQGLPVSRALDILNFTPRKGAFLVGKTLKSAIANAENNHDLAADALTIKEAVVGSGRSLKRFKPRARGSASPIKKRTSHIYITLTDEVEIPEPRKKSKVTRKTTRKKRIAAAAGLGDPKPAAPKAAEEPETPTVETETPAEEIAVAEATEGAEAPAAETAAEPEAVEGESSEAPVEGEEKKED
ncbi:MAG: 50S ribosomal protein L22 [Verrucomicrobiales bacterium]